MTAIQADRTKTAAVRVVVVVVVVIICIIVVVVVVCVGGAEAGGRTRVAARRNAVIVGVVSGGGGGSSQTGCDERNVDRLCCLTAAAAVGRLLEPTGRRRVVKSAAGGGAGAGAALARHMRHRLLEAYVAIQAGANLHHLVAHEPLSHLHALFGAAACAVVVVVDAVYGRVGGHDATAAGGTSVASAAGARVHYERAGPHEQAGGQQ